jgi:hypothetical protein
MSSRYAVAQRLEFVRMAEPGEAEFGYSLWRDPEPPGLDGWLSPGDVQQMGLTDRMRTALAAAENASPDIREPQEGPQEATDDAPKARTRPTVLGGYTDVWRWQAVEDSDGDIVWAVDNRPGLEAARKQGEAFEFQHVTIPDDVLRAIIGS